MPIARSDTVQTTPGTAVTIAVLANDIGTGLAIIGVGQPSQGTVVLTADQRLTYTPPAGFQGVTSFTYTIRDAEGLTAQATVTVSVMPPNKPPVANDDVAAGVAGTTVVIPVLANDSDPDGDPLTIVAVQAASQGSLSVAGDQTIRYLPRAGYQGEDGFTYTVGDGRGGTARAAVRVAVVAPNQPPVAGDGHVTTASGVPVSIDLLAEASDPDRDELRLAGLTLPANGTLAVQDARRVLYSPAPGFVGADGFGYTITDGRGGTASGRITIQVLLQNRAPVAANDNAATPAGQPVTIAVLANDSDPDGDPLTLVRVGLPEHGTLAVNADRTVTYTPAVGHVGADAFDYTIADGRGGEATATVAVTVTAPPSPTTYLNGYLHRRTIVVPAASVAGGPHGNFPILIQESGAWLKSVANGGKVESAQGFDLRFELEGGGRLDHELESYDPVLGELVAWVRLPTLGTAGGAVLHLYYGKSGLAAGEADPAGVWRNYLAVYHLPSGQDRTGNGRDLASSNVAEGALIGKAGAFNGTSSVMSLADAGWLNGLAGYSCQMWLKSSLQSTDKGFLAIGPITGQDADLGLGIRYDADGHSGGAVKVLTMEHNISDGRTRMETAANLATIQRQQVVLTWAQGQQPKLYTDGATLPPSYVNAARSGLTAFGAGPLRIGASAKDSASGGWNGLIDEVRFRALALSPEWIVTEYANQNDPQGFYGLGGEDTFGDANRAPVALPVTAGTESGVAVDIPVLAVALDPDPGTVLTIDQLGTPSVGTAVIVGGQIRYTPPAAFVGTAVFTYRISDGAKTSTGKVSVVVAAAAPAPLLPEPTIDAAWGGEAMGLPTFCDSPSDVKINASSVAGRFKAWHSGTVASIHWQTRRDTAKGVNGYSKGNGGLIRLTVHPDDGTGRPNMAVELGRTAINNGKTAPLCVDGQGAHTISSINQSTVVQQYENWLFTTKPTLVIGQAYHLVATNSVGDPNNNYSSANGLIQYNYKGANSTYGSRVTPDGGHFGGPVLKDDHRVFKGSGTSWTIQTPHHCMYWTMNYEDGVRTGVPCCLGGGRAQIAFGGSTRYRMDFKANQRGVLGRSYDRVIFRVHRRGGDVPGNITITLKDAASGATIATATIPVVQITVTENQLGGPYPVWPFLAAALSAPFTPVEGQLYRIEVSCAGVVRTVLTGQGQPDAFRSGEWWDATTYLSTDNGSTWTPTAMTAYLGNLKDTLSIAFLPARNS